ncbi:3,4-dihydroxy-2-butanone-4-phosphate synthase [Rhodococcus sp. USK10]|uniref:3,4-dihydroxy-2-butanone 4-phosphate synthase / GTP cyclohydrolase II n=1 Tax=Rhodococcus wratislaviensis TaxID=44752 RepID=A0A402BZJ4_RHOWR|nr:MULTISPECIES: 3,4-dihydroxy-2-butanone-4-phosphate synthase [Rhodococcus]QYB05667.1 3,4-dihydroxy-2-butanone-4-phosphate synthase [Rhodococcus sp. USK10]GCE36766.1 3,4-dihydroxy-2-butanone 4-phosphate synthase / GTP cyclohydrolase II [Rhodococcus wratislaviensis]
MNTVEQCLEQLRAGRPILVLDDKNRQNEADLVMAAQFVTTQDAAYFLRHTSGFFGVAMPAERTRALGLPLMVGDPTSPLGTAFTVSVDAATGTSTGISAADRSRTIRLLADRETVDTDLTRPGHVLPLRARDGGVLVRPGHTEAAVDLCTLAGLSPVGLICAVTTADKRDMLRGDDVRAFAVRENLPVVTIEELVNYRRRTAAIERCADAEIPTDHGAFRAIAYRSTSGVEHLALVFGDPAGTTALTHLHSECLTADFLGSRRCDCGDQLSGALARIADAGAGVVLYFRGHKGRGIGLAAKIAAYQLQDHPGLDTVDADLQLVLPADVRDYAAAILRDLRIDRINLLSDNPAKAAGLTAAGITIAGTTPVEIAPNDHNSLYLTTKRDRLGHRLARTRLTATPEIVG